eukprot:g3685.t1
MLKTTLFLAACMMMALTEGNLVEEEVQVSATVDDEDTAWERVVLLSKSPRITLHRNFLSDEECDRLKEIGPTLSRRWDNAATFNSAYWSGGSHWRNAFIRGIEARIANLTGIQPHPLQEELCIHRITAKEDDEMRIDEIHHDKNNKPYTTVTLLAYLETVEKGGETIFPCAKRILQGSEVEENKEMRRACRKLYDYGVRWTNGERTLLHGQQHWAGRQHDKKQHPEIEKELQYVLQTTSEMCAETSSVGGVKVTPRKGDAIVFNHDDSFFKGDAYAFHTG